MKRFIAVLIFTLTLPCILLCACAAKADPLDYISEKRSGVFLYSDDSVDIKIYCVSREQPYCLDGFCGNVCSLVEIYAVFAANPQTVGAYIGNDGGEMNYEAVNSRYVLSFTHATYDGEGVDIEIVCDGESKTYRALNVGGGEIISCEQAVQCAREYDGELFASLTAKSDFKGEISVRLLFDDGCYYYVGVCDRDKNISAYLLDGVKGKVIASKKLKAE